MKKPYILVVDDEPDIRNLVHEILEDEGYQVAVAENAAGARLALRERKPNLVLLDIWMPDEDGISLLKEWREGDGLPGQVIMISGHGSVDTAVEATRLGAYDYLEKPLSLAKLLLTVERALEADRLNRENVDLKKRVARPSEPIGRSKTMTLLREQIKRLAQHESRVLICGEPGTGRETFACFLHQQSKRRDQPFIDLNIKSLPSERASVELFGAESKGQVQPGLLEQANGGTLFLDEVTDMDLDTQAQLVRALGAGHFVRIGGVETIELDARVIAATRHDLHQAVSAGRFREDLYYQLNVVPLEIPPLREHPEDIPDLLEHFVDYFAKKERLPFRLFTTAAINFLRNHSWPGNVLELRNLVQRLLILGGDSDIDRAEVEAALGEVDTKTTNSKVPGLSFDQPLRQAREQFERAYLDYQLNKHQSNISKMAEEVGMERTHLYRKLRSVGIEIKDRR